MPGALLQGSVRTTNLESDAPKTRVMVYDGAFSWYLPSVSVRGVKVDWFRV